MHNIVCIAGLCGAGKSVVSEYIVQEGFQYLHIGKITMDILKQKNLVINETNERQVRESLRKQYGMEAYALLNLEKLTHLSSQGHVVADGLYSFSEYVVLKDHFKQNLIVLAVYAPPQLRYQRLSVRPERQLTPDEAKKRDFNEIMNVEKGGPIAMADITINNTGSFEELRKQVREAINVIKIH